MRNFVGSFDCIDKAKMEKKRMMKHNYLTTNHFGGG